MLHFSMCHSSWYFPCAVLSILLHTPVPCSLNLTVLLLLPAGPAMLLRVCLSATRMDCCRYGALLQLPFSMAHVHKQVWQQLSVYACQHRALSYTRRLHCLIALPASPMHEHDSHTWKNQVCYHSLSLCPSPSVVLLQSMSAGGLSSLVSSVARLQLPLSPMLEDGITHRLDKVCGFVLRGCDGLDRPLLCERRFAWPASILACVNGGLVFGAACYVTPAHVQSVVLDLCGSYIMHLGLTEA